MDRKSLCRQVVLGRLLWHWSPSRHLKWSLFWSRRSQRSLSAVPPASLAVAVPEPSPRCRCRSHHRHHRRHSPGRRSNLHGRLGVPAGTEGVHCGSCLCRAIGRRPIKANVRRGRASEYGKRAGDRRSLQGSRGGHHRFLVQLPAQFVADNQTAKGSTSTEFGLWTGSPTMRLRSRGHGSSALPGFAAAPSRVSDPGRCISQPRRAPRVFTTCKRN